MTDILQLTATELGDAIDKGDLGPIEITKTYLDAITAHPLYPRIYSELTQDRALAEAKDAEERARLGLRRSPLDGVPIKRVKSAHLEVYVTHAEDGQQPCRLTLRPTQPK